MKRLSLSPISAAILMAIASYSIAEEKTNSNYTFSLNKVTVAATLNEQKMEDVANTVSIIDAEAIDKTHATNIRDMMRYEPGVKVGNGSGSDAERYGSKGFNIRGMDENYVKITVDGVDQAKSFVPAGNFFQRIGRNNVDIDSLKRVEVVKGPVSTLYGSDAIGGVVAFTTKDPSDYLNKEGDAFGGSFKLGASNLDDNFSQTMSLANRTGKLESLLVFTNRSASELDSHHDVDIQRDSVDFSSQNILAKLQYQINDAHRLGLTVEKYSADTDTDMQRKLASPSYSDYYFGEDTNDRNRISLSHTWQANNVLFDSSSLTIDRQETESDQETHTVYRGNARIKDYGQEETLNRFSAQFDKTAGIHQLTYGFEYKDTELTNYQDTLYPNDPATNNIDRAVPLVDGTDVGVYLQDQISMMDGNLIITPGVRYDRHEAEPTLDANFNPDSAISSAYGKHDSDKVTFRLGTIYKINDEFSVFGQYSQGFKSPDLLPLYYSSYRDYTSFGSGIFVTLPNPALEPEESDSFEAGFRFNHSHGSVEVVGFYNEYSDFIDSVSVDPTYNGTTYDNVSQSINVAEVTIKGLEARASAWLDSTLGAPEGTSMQISIAYADGENDVDGTPLDSVAPINGVVGLNYDAPSDKWGAALNWTLVEEKKTSDLSDASSARTHGYGVVDLSAYFQPTEHIKLSAYANNLNNKKYQEWEDVRGLRDTTNLDRRTQPGRSFSVSASYLF